MTLDASGNLGIGTTSPIANSRLTLAATAGNALIIQKRTDSEQAGGGLIGVGSDDVIDAAIYLGNGSDQVVTLWNAGAERARIDSSGNLLIGTISTTGNGFVVQPNGSDTNVPLIDTRGNSSSNSLASIRVYSTSLNQDQFYVGYGGTVYARSTSISGLSDQREKENIRPLETGLSQVLALQPRRFDWKNGQGANVAGFVAQEVQNVLPELIDEYNLNDSEKRLALKMGDMIPTLVKAIQEQQAIIEQLKARLDAANL
jgi:hypothetical protein